MELPKYFEFLIKKRGTIPLYNMIEPVLPEGIADDKDSPELTKNIKLHNENELKYKYFKYSNNAYNFHHLIEDSNMISVNIEQYILYLAEHIFFVNSKNYEFFENHIKVIYTLMKMYKNLVKPLFDTEEYSYTKEFFIKEYKDLLLQLASLYKIFKSDLIRHFNCNGEESLFNDNSIFAILYRLSKKKYEEENIIKEFIDITEGYEYQKWLIKETADYEQYIIEELAAEIEAKRLEAEIEAKRIATELEAKTLSVEIEAKRMATEIEAKTLSAEIEAKRLATEIEAKTLSAEIEVKKLTEFNAKKKEALDLYLLDL